MASERNRTCWGLTGQDRLGWCKNKGDWLFFCGHHKKHWILYLALLFTLGSWAEQSMRAAEFMRGPPPAELELLADAYTDISFACHGWKNTYMALFPQVGIGTSPGKYENAWDRLREEPKPSFSQENWARYRPLFGQYLDKAMQELQVAHATYGDILPANVRSHIRGVRQQLSLEQRMYLQLGQSELPEELATVFRSDDGYAHLFESVIRELEGLAREVEALRDDVEERLE